MTTQEYIEAMAPGSAIRPEALAAISSYVSHEYGTTGYVVETITGYRRSVALAVVAHSDGSRFAVIADEWGNAETMPDDYQEHGRATIARFYSRAVSA